MKRGDDLGSRHRLGEPVIHVDESCAVLDCVLEDSDFFLDGSFELTAAFLASAGRYDGNRQPVPAGMHGLARVDEIVESNLNAVCSR